jgi:hypothetical protein
MIQVVILYIFRVQVQVEDSGQYLKKEDFYHQMKEAEAQEAEAEEEEAKQEEQAQAEAEALLQERQSHKQ